MFGAGVWAKASEDKKNNSTTHAMCIGICGLTIIWWSVLFMPIKRTGALFIVQRISFITFCGGMLLIESLRLKGFRVKRFYELHNSLILNSQFTNSQFTRIIKSMYLCICQGICVYLHRI